MSVLTDSDWSVAAAVKSLLIGSAVPAVVSNNTSEVSKSAL